MHPYLNIAIRAALRAGAIICRHYDHPVEKLEVFEKGVNDLVTLVDKAAEDAIIDTIYKAYPHHSVLAEESGAHSGNEFTWVIDPLDGTMNFIHGFPQFAVSIGLMQKGVIEHAVVYDPISQDLYTASKGSGAQLNNRRIRVTPRDTLNGALIGIAFPFRERSGPKTVPWEQHANTLNALIFDRLIDTRKVGSAALNLAYVASGKLDGFFEPSLKPWDIAAGVLLVREAGGFVSDFSGGNQFLDNGNIVAGTQKIQAELLQVIQKNGLT